MGRGGEMEQRLWEKVLQFVVVVVVSLYSGRGKEAFWGLSFFCLFVCLFLEPHPWYTEVTRLGVESEL